MDGGGRGCPVPASARQTAGGRRGPDGTFETLWNGFPPVFHCSTGHAARRRTGTAMLHAITGLPGG
ncbi:protein of unknown function (plasmid) [Azospirillum lipoferum 4B]|uniref:Uncharacterized protein n=1 Tax=Azospirillum lipoferum (strain 4B) TaxID=862719 RepID=G7ZEK1_AZOL4|nr:protein of unknown function [Azospirillum lipoferum 4B]